MLAVEKSAQGEKIQLSFFCCHSGTSGKNACDALQHIKDRRNYDYPFPLPDFPLLVRVVSLQKAAYRVRTPKYLVLQSSQMHSWIFLVDLGEREAGGSP